jgi:CheY-like chemotaxis protein
LEKQLAVKRALTIDDDVEIRRNLRAGLMAAGWQVEEAADGLSGLEQIRRLSAEGAGFNCIICGAILPALDSILFLRTLRMQYPALPIIVLTAYPEEAYREAVLQLQPLAYLEKPLDMAALLEVLFKFDLQTSTINPAPVPESATKRQLEAYAFLRLQARERWAEIYQLYRNMPGVRFADAVKGDVDLILRLSGDNADELQAAIGRVKQVEGVTVVAMDKLELPRLSPEVEEFLQHYHTIALHDREQYVALRPTNAFLIMDIDRYQLERIYTSVVMTEGVISCQVSGYGSKLIALMSGAVQPEVARHVLRKIAVMDGIRRVREAPVINIGE